MTEEKTEEMIKPMMKAIEDLKKRVDMLSDMVDKGKGQVEEFTKGNPMPALGIAFLIGIATGAVVVAAVASSK